MKNRDTLYAVVRTLDKTLPCLISVHPNAVAADIARDNAIQFMKDHDIRGFSFEVQAVTFYE